MRSALRIGPIPADANADHVVFAMIETPEGLANVKEICATPGLDGIYVGPSDLALAVGGAFLGGPRCRPRFNAALERIRKACVATASCPASTPRPAPSPRQRLAARVHVRYRSLRT